MLLRHTPKEVKEREALTINPAKTCQPIGAMYAALGLHKCLPHSHGSQGCCAYHRSTLTRHYKEPIMASTSSFTEGSSVFGGSSNLLLALGTIFSVYNPDIVAVHTTCLSETIGDDLSQIINKAYDEGKIPEGKVVFHANTPSYVGSHVTGFSNMCEAIVRKLVDKSGEAKKQVNLLPGWVEPSDMREYKRLFKELGVDGKLLIDTSDVLDTPLTGHYEFYPKGGTTLADLKTMGDSLATVALGPSCSGHSAKTFEEKHGQAQHVLELPIGLQATDRFIETVRELTGVEVPDSITDERGRVLDFISDMEQYFAGKRVALWGDPDQLIPLCEFLALMNMKPVYIVTGTPEPTFEKRLKAALGDELYAEAKVKRGAQADMFLMHQWIKNESVDLLIGNSYGKFIARDEDIPLLRFGFPILDRVGHSIFPNVGYAGCLRLVERMLNLLLDRKDRDSDEFKVELVL